MGTGLIEPPGQHFLRARREAHHGRQEPFWVGEERLEDEANHFFDPFNEGQTVERDIATMRVIIDAWESLNGVVDESDPNNCYYFAFDAVDQSRVDTAMTPGWAFFQVMRRLHRAPFIFFANARRDIGKMKRLIKDFMWTEGD
jgi:hypothetical protein